MSSKNIFPNFRQTNYHSRLNALQNQRMFVQNNQTVNAAISQASTYSSTRTPKTNSMLIVMDQLMSYNQLPQFLLDVLPGYQAFKKIGIEFTNIHNNRQVCSPSRASFMSSTMDTGVQDNIDQKYQYDAIPKLSTELDTVGKIFKQDGYNITAYYGKSHIDSKLATTEFTIPMYNTNTRGAMRSYGYDIFSNYGDSFYNRNQGYTSDEKELEYIVHSDTQEFDFFDRTNGNKLCGVLPFLKARVADKKSFHLEWHIVNPHDTQHFWQNLEQEPKKSQLQYWRPFIKEQTEFSNVNNPYVYDSNFTDAFIKNTNLLINFFETTYPEYKNSNSTLPFLDSFLNDYSTDPSNNGILPYLVGSALSYEFLFSFAKDKTDIKSWKNLINNYFCLIRLADSYVYKIYIYLRNSGLLRNTSIVITADHGDMMSSHGLKQKGFFFRECTNIPFIIYSPYLISNLIGTKNNILGSLLDLAPTLVTLSNINLNNRFFGDSLVQWVNGRILPRTTDGIVTHIVNAYMLYSSYFFFPAWYVKQSEITKQKVNNVSRNFYDYQGFFNMIITKKDDIQYKFVRMFSTVSLLLYNYMYNQKLALYNYIEKELLINTIKNIIDSNLKDSVYYNQLLNDLNKFSEFISLTFENGMISFNDLYTNLTNKDDFSDSIFLHFTILGFVNITKNIINDKYILPGSNSSYDQLKLNKNYTFLCYNMDSDPHEVINISDSKFPDRHDTSLFNYLNDELNMSFTRYGMNEFTFILPNSIVLSLLLSSYRFGEFVALYTPTQSYIVSSYLGMNNFDSPDLIIDSLSTIKF
jgi:arylsulfatase A-like enzyme